MDKNQEEYLSPFLLSLTSMLVDGEINIEGKCSQAALTVAGLTTYNIRTIKGPELQISIIAIMIRKKKHQLIFTLD